MGLYYLPSVRHYIDADTGLVMPARLYGSNGVPTYRENFMVTNCTSKWYNSLSSRDKGVVNSIAPDSWVKQMNQ